MLSIICFSGKWVAAGRRFDHGDSETNIPIENVWKLLKYVFLECEVNLRPGHLLDDFLEFQEMGLPLLHLLLTTIGEGCVTVSSKLTGSVIAGSCLMARSIR